MIPVFNHNHRVFLGCWIIWVYMDTMTGAVELIAVWCNDFFKLIIPLFFDSCHTRFTSIICGNACNFLPIFIHIEYCTWQRDSCVCIFLGNDNGGLPHIFECQQDIFFSCPFYGFYMLIFFVSLWWIALGYAITSKWKFISFKRYHTIKTCGRSCLKRTVYLFKFKDCTFQ